MNKLCVIAAMIIVWTVGARAQESAQPVQTQDVNAQTDQQTPRDPATIQRHARPSGQATRTAQMKKETHVPSIIQSELDRSRAEAKQPAPAQTQPAAQPSPKTPLWPLFVSLGIGALATCGLLLYFLRRKMNTTSSVERAPSPVAHTQTEQHASLLPSAGSAARVYADEDEPVGHDYELVAVTSASPYIGDDETEMPEAALTMNLLNKKRDTKKELILEVMKRVQRKENPQHIAESLRIGIGEVHLAMTLAKMKK